MPLSAYNQQTQQFVGGVALTDTDLNAAVTDLKTAPVALAKLAQTGASVGQVIAWNGGSYAPMTINTGGGSTVNLGTITPLIDGYPTAGTSSNAAREDHVHPTDASRYAASNPLQFQTSSQVNAAIAAALSGVSGGGVPSSATPLMDSSSGAVGTSNVYARGDHQHPTDTSRAPLANPTFTGTVTLSSAGAGITIGSSASAGTPHLYFLSSGNASNAYDACFEVTGGANGSNGQGTFNIKAATLQLNGVTIGGTGSKPPTVVISSTYQVLPSDTYLVVRSSASGPVTVLLEIQPAASRGPLWIKDGSGTAGTTNPITIRSSGPLIDGQTSIIIGVNYGSETILFDGASYGII